MQKKSDRMEETEHMSMAIATLWDRMKQEEPMVHCMTHAITMNDSANAILVVGASPIMASHPREVEEVVSHSDSLVVNLGNITDVRMEAMMKAGKRAWSLQIPTLIDVVGIGTSTLRYDFAKAFIDACHPGIIKGNSSEIRRLMGLPSHAKGVDSSREDQVTVETIAQLAGPMRDFATRMDAVIVMTGPIDMIVHPHGITGVKNGSPAMGHVTGTGCMLGAIIGAYHAVGPSFDAALIGTIHMGLAGEEAWQTSQGYGTFHVHLLDALGTMTKEKILEEMDILTIP